MLSAIASAAPAKPDITPKPAASRDSFRDQLDSQFEKASPAAAGQKPSANVKESTEPAEEFDAVPAVEESAPAETAPTDADADAAATDEASIAATLAAADVKVTPVQDAAAGQTATESPAKPTVQPKPSEVRTAEAMNADADGQSTSAGVGKQGAIELDVETTARADSAETDNFERPGFAKEVLARLGVATEVSADVDGGDVAPATNTQSALRVEAGPAPTAKAEVLPQRPADVADQAIQSVRSQLLPRGGQMQIQLDPPELGSLQIAVKVIDGRVTATFTASNEQASQMLGHRLEHLRQSLESTGVTVDRIQVKTASESSNQRDGQSNQHGNGHGEGAWHQSEHQRRETARRMWRRVYGGADELDLVA